jgi:hypothetical protein
MHRTRAAGLAAAVLVPLLVVVPAMALNITGTNGNDVLRGTAKADRINGRGGNDRLSGRGGADTLVGGPGRDSLDGGAGNDRFLIRDGARDTATCGPGRDTVTADASDAARADCETVLRPVPSPPPLPPVGTSRDNPFPLGSAGDVGGGWTVTVTNVYPDATALVLAANPFNVPPSPGRQFFMIAVSATYSGPGSSRLGSGFSMRSVGASQVVYTTFDAEFCGVLPEPNIDLFDPEVFTGGTVSGNAACWSIRSSDAASLVMFYEPLASDQRTWFALR